LPLRYHVTCGLRGPSRLYDVTTHHYQHVLLCIYVVAFKLVYFVQFELKITRALAYVQAFFPCIKLKCVIKINQWVT